MMRKYKGMPEVRRDGGNKLFLELWLGGEEGSEDDQTWGILMLTPDQARYLAMLLVEYAETMLATGPAERGHNTAMILLKRKVGTMIGGSIVVSHDEVMVRGKLV